MENTYIKVLQENLNTIRILTKMTSEEFGNKIGVTKQTISNLENNKTSMTKAQYIAIRVIIDCEISKTKNDVLFKIIKLLLDGYMNELSEGEKSKVKDAISVIVSATKGKADDSGIETLYKAMLEPIISKIELNESIEDISIPKWI